MLVCCCCWWWWWWWWWWLEMWQSANSTTFELWTFSPYLKFDKRFEQFVVECEFVEKSLLYDWFHTHRLPESADNSVLFLKFNLSHKLGLQLYMNEQLNRDYIVRMLYRDAYWHRLYFLEHWTTSEQSAFINIVKLIQCV